MNSLHSCPTCKEPFAKFPDPSCICNKPLLLYVEPGKHVHLTCPVHGDFVVSGGSAIFC